MAVETVHEAAILIELLPTIRVALASEYKAGHNDGRLETEQLLNQLPGELK